MPKSILWLLLVGVLVIVGCLPVRAQSSGSDGFADSSFRRIWTSTDAAVASGAAGRSWIWGAQPGERRYERYSGAPGGARLVQYFDKARMEINDPAGDRAGPWFVTNGLLVVEMISGRLQVDDDTFEQRTPAAVPIAGDPLNNAEAPTYAALAPVASTDGNNAAPARMGERVSAFFGPGGIEEQPELAAPETEIVRYEPATGHNLPRVFEQFLQSLGIDPLFAFGYPISEPYWTQVNVDGQPQTVLFQAFERRMLTYNPANPDPWKVEMGNVGQHYLRWRYGRGPGYAQPPLPEGVRVSETTLEILTYPYEQALVPTEPGDPIYPYPRLDPARVGEPEMRSYRAVVVENRFLVLTFLPELGGRLYRAVDKATGQNIFYQNPVIKPSPFGQRGWWLGVGGLEWAAPTEEHGYLEYLPWEISQSVQGDAATIRLTAREQQTGMQVIGTVTLPAEEGHFQVRMDVVNGTDAPHPLQMWTNAILAPGAGNHLAEGVRFVVPTSEMIVHAAQDSQLPAPRERFSWPMVGRRDMSIPDNWNGYVGAFAPQPVPFFGLYDRNQDAGAAIIQGDGARGAKIFAFSEKFDRSLFTDDNSDYAELWSGAQPTFWDYPPLEPGSTRSINADWLPLWGLGDLTTAAPDGALGVTQRPDGGTTVALSVVRIIPAAVVVVRVGGREVFRTAALDLRPDQPLSIDLPEDAADQPIQVEAPGLLLERP